MPIPAFSAKPLTVFTSQYSVEPSLPSITLAPVDILAIDLDIRSEMIAPVKPTTAEKASSGPTSMPSCISARSRPSTLMTIEITARTATFVRTKRKMRFIGSSPRRRESGPRLYPTTVNPSRWFRCAPEPAAQDPSPSRA